MIFPKKVNLFRYDKKDIFYLEDETILKKIFMTKNYNYRPYKTYTQFGNEFLIKVEVKKSIIVSLMKLQGLIKIQ